MGEIVPAERPERALYPVWAILAVEAGQLARGVLAGLWSPEPETAAGGHELESCPEVVCAACPDVSCQPCPAAPACPAAPDPWQAAGAGAGAIVVAQAVWWLARKPWGRARRGHGVAPARRGGGVVA